LALLPARRHEFCQVCGFFVAIDMMHNHKHIYIAPLRGGLEALERSQLGGLKAGVKKECL